ncbi:MAG: domain S-box [Chlorobi bacterium]|nr:domain S-box [Chlorobiota bacterium]
MNTPITILLIDDDRNYHILIRNLLMRSRLQFQLRTVATFVEGLEAIMDPAVDISLVDYRMGDRTGVEILRHAIQHGIHTPIILLTGYGDHEIDMEAMAAGASDYLYKGNLDDRILERAIRYALERKRLSDELRQSEERLRTVVASAPIILCSVDVNGIITLFEGHSVGKLGIDPGLVVGARVEDFLAYVPKLVSATSRALAGETFTEIVRFSDVVIDCRFSPSLNAAGEIVGMVGVATDITERIRQEDALRRSRLELKEERDFISSVLDTVGALVLVFDHDMNIVRFNRACEDISGYSFEEVAGRNVIDLLVPPDEAESLTRDFSGLEHGEIQRTRENHWLTRTGERKLIRWTNSALYDSDGSVAFGIGTGIDITAQRAAEQGLRDSERMFQTFMNNSPVITYLKDGEGRYTFANREFCRLFDLRLEDVIGRTDYELFPSEVAEGLVAADAEVHAGGGTITRIDSTDYNGQIHHWITIRFPVVNAVGEMMVGGKSIDITARILAEESLRKSEERFQLATRATNDAIWDWDLQSNTLWWNDSVQKLFGYEPDEVAPDLKWWQVRLHPDDRERVESGLHAAIAEKRQFWDDEYRFLRGDGAWAYVLDRGYLIFDKEEKPVRVIGAMTDLTQRKEMEDALRASEERYRHIVETANEGIWLVDPNARVSFVNARMAEMLGYSVAEMTGCSIYDFIAPEWKGVGREHHAKRLIGVQEQYDFQFVRSDGTRVWAIISAGPVYDGSGAFAGSLAMITDITERKNAENALREAHDKLEMRVAERTAEIVEMMSHLEQVHLNQRRFVADASHDLRTPLTVLRAELDQLLGHAGLDQRTRSALLRIANESRRMEHLAADLLLLATLDAQQKVITSNRVWLDGLLIDSVAQLTMIAMEKNISWDVQIEEPVEVLCDLTMLERALTNVLENAIKYSAGPSAVEVRLARSDGAAVIAVRDHGVGIPAGDLPYVFDRFFRGDLTRGTPGTGLGLPIVKAVVEAHHGIVSLTSEVGVGTTVTVVLPVAAAD